ncbi:response regulator [Deferrisoma palaeochoriense]
MSAGADTPKVLFVDDEENVLRALRRLFRREPWALGFATSGEEALRRFEAEGPFDVVVADQRMPGMTGVELLRRLKALHPECVRIVLSGYTDVNAVIEAVNEGAIFKFLTKPWDDEVLRATVAEAAEAVTLRRRCEVLRVRVEAQNAELAAINRCLEKTIRQGLEARSAGLARAVLEAAPVALVAVGEDGKVALANRAARERLGDGAALGRAWGEAPGPVAGASPVEAPGWRGTVYRIGEG